METGGKSSEISFMYKPPPGYAAVKEAEKKAEDMQGPAPPDEVRRLFLCIIISFSFINLFFFMSN